MKLRCVARYRNDARGLVYTVGDEFDATDDVGAFLLSDAPDCFEAVTPKAEAKTRALDEPSEDKMMHAPPRKKSGA